MNELLKNYLVDVEYPEASGIEHLQMLERRSQLMEIEATLSAAEQQALANADRQLAIKADKFLHELNCFVVLAQERQQRQVSPDEWWWYLDILVRVPAVPGRSEDFVAA
jgi:hypothetical protein